jgi:hypothetical protein
MSTIDDIKQEVENAEQLYLKAYNEAQDAVAVCASAKTIWDGMKATLADLEVKQAAKGFHTELKTHEGAEDRRSPIILDVKESAPLAKTK